MEHTLTGTDQEDSTGSLIYPWYIVSLCMLAYIFSFIVCRYNDTYFGLKVWNFSFNKK
ncbi:MAG: hypothetical protein IIA75_09060 [Proteobacteria bacterium]|nr:hypothetical protein [Pseudomonadota bacterium]